MYKEFAEIYDELMNDFDYKKWFEYMEEIFKEYQVKPKKVLEMACGTGNLSEYFAMNNYDLTAFDLSEEMLAIAYKKMYRNKNVKLLNQNMVDFNLNKKFDSIICICDSINYILSERDLEATFDNVYRHLEDGGLFIFDINSFYKLKEVIGNNIFVENREDIFYVWENEYEEEEEICSFYLTFFNKVDDLYERFEEEHHERAYRTGEIVALLNKVGFKDINYYDAFTFERVEENTERINFIVKK